ncbi:MAG TPA: SDR family NAD(P)-dependent oxidoreductase [Kofleriaceae bacterium]|nr:SDR family NAD(P)-dependent oxidoreductase [Kofleriaceae bacterium]
MQSDSGAPRGVDSAAVDACIALLRELAADRRRLDALAPDTRRALLVAAGRLSRPHRDELIAAARARRRAERRERKRQDLALLAATEIRAAQRSSIYVPPRLQLADGDGDLGRELHEPRACYVCKAPYRRVHFFYHAMCPDCARLNYHKRHQTADLRGRVALVTGARVKIGYQIALMLLRAGARVVATTRFPHDAAARYAREEDHVDWADRLEIHGLDLRHAPSVELFAGALDRRLDRLDFLINNAAQTVRRPPAFYAHLLAGERRPLAELPEPERRLVAAHAELRAELASGGGGGDPSPAEGIVAWRGAAVGLSAAPLLSQLPLTPEDHEHAGFPAGELDPDLQQVDRRRVNSWRLGLADVSTPELLEVHLVNAIAPFILNSRLKPLMSRRPTGDRHIVNVSAMEAQFSRNKKTDKHPHTNMAKAALNMMTRTSAVDYVASGIHMNSVDTGWVTDEDPLHHVDRKQAVHDFHPPLDAVDGAARVLDPIFTGLATGHHMWGLFLKDYRPVDW